MPEPTTITGAHLKSWREVAGMTQAEMADTLKVHPSTIRKWEAGAAMPVWVAERLIRAATQAAPTLARR